MLLPEIVATVESFCEHGQNSLLVQIPGQHGRSPLQSVLGWMLEKTITICMRDSKSLTKSTISHSKRHNIYCFEIHFKLINYIHKIRSSRSAVGERPARIRFAAILHNYAEPYEAWTNDRSTKIAYQLESILKNYDSAANLAALASAGVVTPGASTAVGTPGASMASSPAATGYSSSPATYRSTRR